MTKTRGNQKTKTKTNAGGRSGVIIEEKVENDNVNEWFDTAHTPKAQLKNDASSSSQEEPSVDDGKNRAKTKTSRKKKTVKTPKRQVNMKLPGASEEEEQQQVDSEEEEGEMVSAKAKNYAKKLRRKGGNFTSPSDLSRVSTAPYSPRDDEDRKESAESESKSNQEDDSEIENALLTQAEGGGEEAGLTGENDDDDDVIARQAAAKGNTENLQPASPEDEFPVGGGDDYEEDDGGDDLGPPVLPDDYSEDEEKERGQQSETKKKNDIGGLDNSDDEKNDSVDVSANDYDNDDDEGPGFNMVHDPETPETVRENRAKKENEKLRNEKDKKKKKKKKSESDSDDDDDDDDDDEDSKSTPKVKKGRKQKKKKKRNVVFSPQGIPIANRDYESVPIGALVEGSPDDEDGARRSKRAKVKPLQYWRNEKMEYGAHNEDGYIGEAFGNMPVVTGIQKALPTPYKKRKQPKNNAGAKKNGKKQVSSNAKGNDQEEEFNSKKLRKMYKFHDGEEAYLWDDVTDDTADQKVVAYASNMEGNDLPISKKRRKAEGKVTGKAAQAFNIPSDDNDDYVGYIMGNLVLPPKGIKDSESVGPCAQTFTVCHCQSKAVEVAYGDPDEPDGELDAATAQRFLLGPGDMFRVPPGNCYRLENHSETTDCLLTWTIIRPRSVPS